MCSKYFIYFVALFSLIAFTSCSSTLDEKMLLGKWNLEILIDNDRNSGWIEFYDNNTFVSEMDGEELKGEYRKLLSDEKLILVEMSIPNIFGERALGRIVELPLIFRVNDSEDNLTADILGFIEITLSK